MGNVFALLCVLALAGSPCVGSPAFVVVGDDSPGDTSAAMARVFGDIRTGMLENSVESFAAHFSPRVFIQLPESEGEFYSAKQAFYVVDHYLRDRNVVTVQFSIPETSELHPYAIGDVTIMVGGTRQQARLNVVLAKGGDQWMITHFSIQ